MAERHESQFPSTLLDVTKEHVQRNEQRRLHFAVSGADLGFIRIGPGFLKFPGPPHPTASWDITMTQLHLAVAVYGFLPRRRVIEQAGVVYEAGVVREKIERGDDPRPVYVGNFEEAVSMSKNSSDSDLVAVREDIFDPDDEAYLRYVKSLDTKSPKDQDHYKVLGLSKLRYKATRLEIKQAYRQKSLNHHPDKRKEDRGMNVNDDYFVSINNAYSQLYLKEEDRRAYDSVDPTFDDYVPSPSEVNSENFYSVFKPLFEMNARFSKIYIVPELGDKDKPRDDVENFYEFWFSFDTWREFSYLDQESKERGEDRWERKQIERENKVEREKKRKMEIKRIRTLVQLAYDTDPRIRQFRAMDRKEREQAKEERRLMQLRKKEEERLALEEEERKREEKKRLEKERIAQEKKQRDKEKKALQQARKGFRQTAESAKYWADCHQKQMDCMQEIERICLSADKTTLNELSKKLAAVSIYEDAISLMNSTCKKEEKSGSTGSSAANEAPKATSNVAWTLNENQLLIKASTVYPTGTVDRWSQIAAYINEHRADKTSKPKTEKDVIKQTKAVQKMEFKPAANQNKLGSGVVLKGTGAGDAVAPTATATPTEEVWSAAEQKKLEEGLKTFPSSDPERWEKISSLIGTKSKKDCIRRYKFLVQRVKEKKAAAV